jgi:oligopeptide/dipeptide ABC transporter ATP-binding protein
MRSLQKRLGTALLLITHDFGVVAEMADRVAVMYAGRIVEDGPVAKLFDDPLHPYTRMLMQAAPQATAGGKRKPLANIPGTVPSFVDLPSGCAFHPRCPLAIERCRHEHPALETKRADHAAACFLVPVEAANGA